MHELAKKIADCIKTKVEAKGIDNIEGHDLEELGEWVDIIKDIACYDKDMRIIEAMDNAEDSEESMRYIEMYEDYPDRKGYRGQRRDSRGRYMSRRSYTEPMMMHDDMREKDYMDGRMYYGGSTGGNTSNMGGASSGMSSGSSNTGSRGYSENMGGRMSDRMQRDGREGRSGESRRGYMESKEMGKDKSEKMQNLEEYAKTLTEDVTEMVQGMSPEEKALLKNKMQTLMAKIQ